MQLPWEPFERYTGGSETSVRLFLRVGNQSL